jgi:uncharacterized protein YjiS (DUF1127 family)
MKLVTRSLEEKPSIDYPLPLSATSLWTSLGEIIDAGAMVLLAWSERASQRRDLLGLNDRELHDIGLSRADAVAEGDKPFWSA